MMKIVLKVELHNDKMKQKAMKSVSGISGVASVSVDMKDSELTLTGDIDPVYVVSKLRKLCHTDIVSVKPEKEDKKEDKPKPLDDPYYYYYYHNMIMRPPPPYPYASYVQEDPAAGCVIC